MANDRVGSVTPEINPVKTNKTVYSPTTVNLCIVFTGQVPSYNVQPQTWGLNVKTVN